EPEMPQLILRIVAGHLAKLSDAVLKLTHEALLLPLIIELLTPPGSPALAYFESYTVMGNDSSAVFLPMTSVAFNLTVNFPARLSGSQNCMGANENSRGSSTLLPAIGLLRVAFSRSSRTRISNWMLGSLLSPPR